MRPTSTATSDDLSIFQSRVISNLFILIIGVRIYFKKLLNLGAVAGSPLPALTLAYFITVHATNMSHIF